MDLVTHGLDYDTIRNFINKIDEEDYKKLQKNINRVQKEYTWKSHVRKLINDY
ncbi:hypothetical protein [Saccharolobus islandicus]|uniref:hypothetical protein n=1 Tax=Saccharolobus islandicus TaxID=43080 RepID=UPI000B181BB4|nr:hypothetical protein [Sulfolobus islandicus]